MWHPKWRHVRALAIWAAGLVLAVVFIPPAGEFFTVLARSHQLYDNPDKTVTGVLSALHGLAMSWWFGWFGGLVIGFAVGAWLDWFFGRSARQAQVLERSDLATRAETLAQGISALVGEYEGRRSEVWHEDTQDLIAGKKGRPRSQIVESNFSQKYGEKYHGEAWIVINAAGQLISIDQRDTFSVLHGTGLSDAHHMVDLLTRLAGRLRYEPYSR